MSMQQTETRIVNPHAFDQDPGVAKMDRKHFPDPAKPEVIPVSPETVKDLLATYEQYDSERVSALQASRAKDEQIHPKHLLLPEFGQRTAAESFGQAVMTVFKPKKHKL